MTFEEWTVKTRSVHIRAETLCERLGSLATVCIEQGCRLQAMKLLAIAERVQELKNKTQVSLYLDSIQVD